MTTGFDLVDTLLLAVFPIAMVIAAVSDLLTMQISNRISLLLIAAFAVFAGWVGLDWSVIGMHVLTAAVVLLLGFTAFAFGQMGGGDAKLAAVIGLWFGWSYTIQFLLIASVIGGGLTLGILMLRRMPLPAAITHIPWFARIYSAANGVPYGLALTAGALIVYPNTLWLTAALH